VTPYYEESNIQIFHGDARELLSELHGDLVLTDFPYGVNEEYDQYQDTEANLQTLIIDLMPLILKSAPVAMITCGVGNIYKYPKPEWIMSWVTPAGNGSGPWGFCCWQPILAYGKDPYLQSGLGRRPDTFIHTETSNDSDHPCPKPLAIWKKLVIRGSAKEDDVIIDPCAGSGITGRACKDLGRKCIMIELSEAYCEVAANQLRQEVLF